MKRSFGVLPVGFMMATLAACGSHGGNVGQGQASPASAKPAAASARDMIVILRDQMPTLAAGRGARHERAIAIAAAHRPLLDALQATSPRKAHSFELVNGFATRLSSEEIDSLSANPQVLAVVPDGVLRLPKRARDVETGGSSSVNGAVQEGATNALCNTLEPEALQLTHTAYTDPSLPQAHEVVDGSGAKVTGRGVTVGIVADGLDTSVAGFIHADGSKVFVDYQDFSGDPAGTPTAGGEMFGDASSIAAQDTPNGSPLTYDISKFVSAAHPLPSPCNIRIRGMAPGASLVGLKVFSNLGYTTNSSFVQAIEYAVVHDDVDVLNESFGGNGFPDDANDPISLANAAAVRAGVTVVVSTGDAGSAGTLGSPSTDPFVIAAGATTQNRLYAQTSSGMYPLASGYVSGNISAFSSGGFAQRRPRTTDLVAPGDLGWALCSPNTSLYQDCSDYNGVDSSIEVFGGTSESAPLTSGAAALVIQAYRSTHGGTSPSPALVKSILMSSASDLGAPSDEQGAGLVDALKAVDVALSVHDDSGSPRARGQGLLAAPGSATFTAQPGASLERVFQVTNTGTSTLHVHPAVETLGAPFAGESLSVTLDPATDPTFVNVVGSKRPYVSQAFTVPAGADHLDAAIAWPVVANPKAYAELLLVDPSGRQVAYSVPQGIGSGYGHVDVVKPAGGRWTAFIRTSPKTSASAINGPVQLTWGVEHFVSAGKALPASLSLAPGATGVIEAQLSAPTTPGDFAAALRLHDSTGSAALSEIPITVRTLIPVGRGGGTFTGTLTGGNGRSGAFPTSTYAFDVPEGVKDLGLTLEVPDNGYLLAGYLVDPNGMLLSAESNVDLTGAKQFALQMFRATPQAGRWRFILEEPQSSGNQTSIAFSARIAFDGAQISAAGLPTSRKTALSASQAAITVPISVTNTGAVAKAYFADARLATLADVALPDGSCATPTTLPGLCAYAYVPPRVTAVQFTAQSTAAPITMDAYSFTGSPDIFAHAIGSGTVVAAIRQPEVAYGAWYMSPALVGPFGPSGAPTDAVTTSTVATMEPFDPAVTASSGNLWADLTLGTATYQPLVLAPGASGTLTLSIQPDASQVGKTVRGFVYVDTYNTSDSYGTGDEVVALPYAYTVAP